MGTMVGDGVDETGQRLQIGVAPGAQWIAVKIFSDSGDTTDVWIHQGFQWFLAPTDLNGENPDPTKAPDIVNNSWGSSNGADVSFRPDVQALHAAGIVPVFSAGNEGAQGSRDCRLPGRFPREHRCRSHGTGPRHRIFQQPGTILLGREEAGIQRTGPADSVEHSRQ